MLKLLASDSPENMKIGAVISTNEPEIVWNAFRYGVMAIANGHSVKVFLLGRGVEAQEIVDSKFDVKGMMEKFAGSGGVILTCGTCLKIRKKEGTELCPVSSMQDMVNLTVESDRLLTFG